MTKVLSSSVFSLPLDYTCLTSGVISPPHTRLLPTPPNHLMEMCIEDVGDAHAKFFGGVAIAIYIAQWIDQHSLFALMRANKIR